jgi:hypothetical protein
MKILFQQLINKIIINISNKIELVIEKLEHTFYIILELYYYILMYLNVNILIIYLIMILLLLYNFIYISYIVYKLINSLLVINVFDKYFISLNLFDNFISLNTPIVLSFSYNSVKNIINKAINFFKKVEVVNYDNKIEILVNKEVITKIDETINKINEINEINENIIDIIIPEGLLDKSSSVYSFSKLLEKNISGIDYNNKFYDVILNSEINNNTFLDLSKIDSETISSDKSNYNERWGLNNYSCDSIEKWILSMENKNNSFLNFDYSDSEEESYKSNWFDSIKEGNNQLDKNYLREFNNLKNDESFLDMSRISFLIIINKNKFIKVINFIKFKIISFFNNFIKSRITNFINKFNIYILIQNFYRNISCLIMGGTSLEIVKDKSFRDQDFSELLANLQLKLDKKIKDLEEDWNNNNYKEFLDWEKHKNNNLIELLKNESDNIDSEELENYINKTELENYTNKTELDQWDIKSMLSKRLKAFKANLHKPLPLTPYERLQIHQEFNTNTRINTVSQFMNYEKELKKSENFVTLFKDLENREDKIDNLINFTGILENDSKDPKFLEELQNKKSEIYKTLKSLGKLDDINNNYQFNNQLSNNEVSPIKSKSFRKIWKLVEKLSSVNDPDPDPTQSKWFD